MLLYLSGCGRAGTEGDQDRGPPHTIAEAGPRRVRALEPRLSAVLPAG